MESLRNNQIIDSKQICFFYSLIERSLPICSAGTCSMGLTSRYSLQCCSPPDLIRLIGFMSYGISFKFNAMRTRHEHELRQYEYKTGCWEDKVNGWSDILRKNYLRRLDVKKHQIHTICTTNSKPCTESICAFCHQFTCKLNKN